MDLASKHSLSIVPLDTNKRPFFKWGPSAIEVGLKNRQVERATRDEIEAWDAKYHPSMWAMITGAVSGIFTLDFDGQSGLAILEQLGISPHRRTGSGGYHIDFKHPGWRVRTINSKKDLKLAERWPGLDIRGDGGYAAIAGHNTNGPYEWLRAFEPEDYTRLPQAMQEYFGLLQAPGQRPVEIRSGPVSKQAPAPAARTLDAQWGIDRIATAGGRNNAAIELAIQLRDNRVSKAEAANIMSDFAHMAPVTDAHGRYAPFTEREALASLEQAYSKPARDPWQTKKLARDIDTLLAELAQDNDTSQAADIPSVQAYPLIAFKPREVSSEEILTCMDSDEYGDAILFTKLLRNLVVYDHADKQWYTWQTHYWKRDGIERIRTLVSGRLSATYLHLQAEINVQEAEMKARIAEAIETEGITSEEAEAMKGKLAPITARLKALGRRAKELKSASRCRNVLYYAVTMLGISSADKDFKGWDNTPWLLGTKDGVVDLRTGELRNGQPGDYIRTVTTTRWKGLDAPARRWEAFLQEIFGDRPQEERDTLIAFLQRMLGMGIIGQVIDHAFLMLYGEEGRNGKDTMLEVIAEVLGALVGAVSKDVLLDPGKARPAGSATPHLVALQGKRLAWASEPAQGSRFDVGQVKLLTGGGEIPVRRLYGEDYSFEPTHLLLILTNHKPHADAKDKAFWNRLCPIVFNLRFLDQSEVNGELAANERFADPYLKDELEQEASGILAWLVRGCMDYQKHGRQTPVSVRQERDRYRQEEDTLALFIQDNCERGDDFKLYRVTKKDLLTRYKAWCMENNLRPLSGPGFTNDLQKLFAYKRVSAGMAFFGVRLKADDNTLSDEEDLRDVVLPKNYIAPKTASEAGSANLAPKGNVDNVVFSQNPPLENSEKFTDTPVIGENYINYIEKKGESCEMASDAVLAPAKGNVETTQKESERAATPEEEAQLQAYEHDLVVDMNKKRTARVMAVWPLVDRNARLLRSEMLEVVRAALLSDDRRRVQAALEEIESRKVG